MRYWTTRAALIGLALVIGACGSEDDGRPAAKDAPMDLSKELIAEIVGEAQAELAADPSAEPAPEVHEVVSDGTSEDIAADVTITDVAITDVAVIDVIVTDASDDHPPPDVSDDAASDAGADTADQADIEPPPTSLHPWTQCQGDAPCQALFGEAAYCNHAFPGGQCQGCTPGWDGDAACTQLGLDGLTLSCKDTWPPVCLFDCPCPHWLRCASGLCILKTCEADEDCAPLTCRPMSEGGASYCLGSAS